MRRAEHAPDARGTIWYMGAKTRLLDALEEAIGPLLAPRAGAARPPTLVDLFAGTGVVGARFADRARIVAGDAQRYAAVLARSLLVPAPRLKERLAPVRRAGEALALRLLSPHAAAAGEERRFLAAHRSGAEVTGRYRAFLEAELARHDPEREMRDGGGVLLSCYRNVYFGLAQAALLDGLRRAIEGEREPERTTLLAALLFAASRATSGTAHFAQPRGLGKAKEVAAMLVRRSIDVLALFDARARVLAREAASARYPERNVVREGACEALLAGLAPGEADVVYADPPYTADHYSRFYHVLETLARGAPPALERNGRGALLRGRYPVLDARFRSRFCSPDDVMGEFRKIGALAAERGAALVWSYSRTNGLLLRRMGGDMGAFRKLLLESHREVSIREIPLRHSGAGDKNHAATELIAVCTGPRGAPRRRGVRAGATASVT